MEVLNLENADRFEGIYLTFERLDATKKEELELEETVLNRYKRDDKDHDKGPDGGTGDKFSGKRTHNQSLNKGQSLKESAPVKRQKA